MKLFPALGVSLALALASTSCTRSAPEGTAKGKAATETQAPAQQARPASERKIPDDFPKDIPVYASYRHVVAVNAGIARGVNLFTNDARPAIAAFYEKELPANGWKVNNVERAGKKEEFQAQKDERLLMVSILDNGPDRTVSLTLVKP